MDNNLSLIRHRRLRKTGKPWLQAAVPALLVALAIPVCAEDARPIKSRVAPVYPEIAKRLQIEGVVSVQATVDLDGKVSGVKTLTGNHALAPSAEDAVRKWRFLSAPDQSTVVVEISFAPEVEQSRNPIRLQLARTSPRRWLLRSPSQCSVGRSRRRQSIVTFIHGPAFFPMSNPCPRAGEQAQVFANQDLAAPKCFLLFRKDSDDLPLTG